MIVALLALLVQPASACDPKALAAAVNEASPVGVGPALVRLDACSPDEARKLAPAAVGRMVDAEGADQALLVGIRAGAWEAVRAWLGRQESDIRTRIVGRVGAVCATTPAVGEFLLDAAAHDPARFWQERWHKGLVECRTASVRALLTEALTGPYVGRGAHNRAGFQSVLEVYARNLGKDAIPTLATLLDEARDDEDLATLLVVVFADAAQVGRGGPDAEAAKAAVAAIEAAAPHMPGRAVERARGTLTALGDEAAANGLARYRWTDRFVDGAYTWGVAAIESFTCKNSEQRAVLHLGSLRDPGTLWSDTAVAAADARARAAWKLDGAARCKGTGEVEVVTSDEPFGDAAAWATEVRDAFARDHGSAKVTIVEEATPLAP